MSVVIDLTSDGEWSNDSDSGGLADELKSLSVDSLKPVVGNPGRGRDDPNASGQVPHET